jgi:hypothetical protein
MALQAGTIQILCIYLAYVPNTRGSSGASLAATICSRSESFLSVVKTLNRRSVSNTDKHGETSHSVITYHSPVLAVQTSIPAPISVSDARAAQSFSSIVAKAPPRLRSGMLELRSRSAPQRATAITAHHSASRTVNFPVIALDDSLG